MVFSVAEERQFLNHSQIEEIIFFMKQLDIRQLHEGTPVATLINLESFNPYLIKV